MVRATRGSFNWDDGGVVRGPGVRPTTGGARFYELQFHFADLDDGFDGGVVRDVSQEFRGVLGER